MNAIYKVEDQRRAVKIDVKNNLEDLQQLVKGYIEVVPSGIDNIVIICNEEGKLNGMKKNFTLLVDGGDELVPSNDCISGPALFVGTDGEDFRSLTPKEIEMVDSYIGQALAS